MLFTALIWYVFFCSDRYSFSDCESGETEGETSGSDNTTLSMREARKFDSEVIASLARVAIDAESAASVEADDIYADVVLLLIGVIKTKWSRRHRALDVSSHIKTLVSYMPIIRSDDCYDHCARRVDEILDSPVIVRMVANEISKAAI